jgi:4-hydroxyphenylpyruvate dioxygenase
VRQRNITFVFQAALRPTRRKGVQTNSEQNKSCEIYEHLDHGDGVRDIALTVNNCRAAYSWAVSQDGAVKICEPWEESDEYGTVVFATVKTYGDTVHTFVERKNYKGDFLPGYKKIELCNGKYAKSLPETGLLCVDHVVGNQPDKEMETVAKQYVRGCFTRMLHNDGLHLCIHNLTESFFREIDTRKSLAFTVIGRSTINRYTQNILHYAQ